MYSQKAILALSAAGILTMGVAGSAMAFHDGGVAKCDGCHSMHQSADNKSGSTLNTQAPTVTSWLTKGSDASSTCLNCHYGTTKSSYKIATADGTALTAGGDFFWMKTTYSYNPGGGTKTTTSSKDNHGHNIIAADFGFLADADTDNVTAPGGTYASAKLGCTSCHDAHGQVQGGTKNGAKAISASGSYGAATPVDGSILGNYRILGDSQYAAGASTDGFGFDHDAPVAVAVNGTNGYGAKVAYGSGMSEWCANCHAGLLVGNSSTGKHPSGNDVKIDGFATNYNSYVKTGDFTGTQATSYNVLVPFERGAGATLDPVSTAGPATGTDGNVMCLTCHRAHASAFDNMTRWDMKNTLLSEGAVLAKTGTLATAGFYYGNDAHIDFHATYGEYQRNLCNKCHAQD